MKIKIFAFIFLFLFSISYVSAIQPVQQYNKIFLNPFYRPSLTASTNYTYNVTINPADKVSNIISSIISFNVQINGQSQALSLWVNGKQCNTPIYSVATAFSTTGQIQMYFDCSNQITRAGTYNITINSAVATGTISGWVDLVYMNNPSGELTIHGTEYSYGQTGKVWLQLLDNGGNNVNAAVCYADIYMPDGGYLIEGATMTNMKHDGIYYYDLVIPIGQGVYPAIAKCYYTAEQDKRNATAYTLITGSLQSGIVTNTNLLDLVYLTIRTTGGGSNNRLNATFNFTDYYNACRNVSELLTTGITIYWNGVWNTGTTNHDVTLSIYNYTSSSWINLPNKILGGSGTSTIAVSNSLSMTNITKLLGVTSTKPVMIKVADNANTDGAKDLKTDYMYASCDQLSSPQWQQVKGSSELHVINPTLYSISTSDDLYALNNSWITTLANGTVINENYYTGIFKNNFEVSSGSLTNTEVLIEYQGLHSIPCNSIITFYQVNSTGYYMKNFTVQRQTTEDHCSVNFLLNLEPGGVYDFEVHARNSWESEMRSTNTGLGSIFPLLDGGCKLWQIVKGYPTYVIPKNHTNEAYDYYYRACGNIYDDYYWFNKTYSQSLSDKLLISDEQSFLQYEADYTSVKFAEEKLNTVANYLLNNLQAVNDYSKLLIDNPLGDAVVNTTDQRYWADKSTLYQAWKIVNATCGTGNCKVNSTLIASDLWNAPSRNLTYYPDNTNYTLITNDVWNYSNRSLTYYADSTNYTLIANTVWGSTVTISASLLNQITTAIWNYGGSININITNDFSDKIWNATARYTHGVIN